MGITNVGGGEFEKRKKEKNPQFLDKHENSS